MKGICLTVLPVLRSDISIVLRSRYTITLRFATWSAENGGGTSPDAYIIQTRTTGSVWEDTANVVHNSSLTHTTVWLQGLLSDTVYFLRCVPYISGGGLQYYGHPTSEQGPVTTLSYGKEESYMNLIVLFLPWRYTVAMGVRRQQSWPINATLANGNLWRHSSTRQYLRWNVWC